MGIAQQARMDALAIKELHEREWRKSMTLAELTLRAINARAVFTYACMEEATTDADWTRLERAEFVARCELRAALMNLGLTKSMIDQIGDVL